MSVCWIVIILNALDISESQGKLQPASLHPRLWGLAVWGKTAAQVCLVSYRNLYWLTCKFPPIQSWCNLIENWVSHAQNNPGNSNWTSRRVSSSIYKASEVVIINWITSSCRSAKRTTNNFIMGRMGTNSPSTGSPA